MFLHLFEMTLAIIGATDALAGKQCDSGIQIQPKLFSVENRIPTGDLKNKTSFYDSGVAQHTRIAIHSKR